MKAEVIRSSIDRAMRLNHFIQCNCKNKHSFSFYPVTHHPILKLKAIYGLVFDCEFPVFTSDNSNEFVRDDEWFYVYHILQIKDNSGTITITKIGEDMKISSFIEFPLKDVKDVLSLKMYEDFDYDCQSLKRIEEAVKHGN